MRRHVQGRCPACGQAQLGLNRSGTLVCCNLDCPRPTALAELIETAQPEHVVQINRDDFTLQHPLIERLDDGLFDCRLSDLIALAGPLDQTGRYLAHLGPTGLEFSPIGRQEP